MGTKSTRKDFYMEIRKSSGRFISILFIVALGVAFFSGIRSSEPSMRITGDAYFDGANLFDIKTVSTLGITKDDIRALQEVDNMAKAEGTYSAAVSYTHLDVYKRQSLDQVGPIAKDVTDCATILEAIASHDPKDSTSIDRNTYCLLYTSRCA